MNFSKRRFLKQFIPTIFHHEGVRLIQLDVIFCDNQYLLRINRQFLQHDFYTDVITFDLSDIPSEIKGEIYISIDMVKENALQYKVNFQHELRRVLFHAALHLCGYNDKKKSEIQMMRKKEELYLNMFHGEH